MRRFVFAVVFGAVAIGPAATASAQNTSTVCKFVAVDAVKVDGWYLVVRGVLAGEAAVSEKKFNFSTPNDTAGSVARLQSCELLALVAMEKPGQHTLELQGPAYLYWPTCALARVNP